MSGTIIRKMRIPKVPANVHTCIKPTHDNNISLSMCSEANKSREKKATYTTHTVSVDTATLFFVCAVSMRSSASTVLCQSICCMWCDRGGFGVGGCEAFQCAASISRFASQRKSDFFLLLLHLTHPGGGLVLASSPGYQAQRTFDVMLCLTYTHIMSTIVNL